MLPEPANPRSLQIEQNRALERILEDWPKFLNFVRSAIHNAGEAEEILQRASLKIISRASSLRNPEREEAWIFRLLRNEIADHYRRLAVSSRRTAELPTEMPTAAWPESPGAKLCPCATEELQNLHSNYSEALRAVEMDGDRIGRHAAHKGISLNNAMVRLHRARKALRTRLERRCGACAGAGCFDCTCSSDSKR